MKFPRFSARLSAPIRWLESRLKPAAVLGAKIGAKIGALLLPLVMTSAVLAQDTTPDTPITSNVITWWQAIVLGLVQGLTEFIPVSSSAHLNIAHRLMGHPRELNYDVMLSVGTVIALAYYFRHDWKALLVDRTQRKLRNLVFFSCIPAGILGVIIHKFESQPPLSEVWFNAVMLVVAGFILLLADKFSTQRRDIETVGLKEALIIGVAQALALFPGVSRSGSTLTAGLLLGFKRSDAMRFSFLMSLPISVGAVLYELRNVRQSNDGAVAIILGILVSAASGFWAIGFLLNYLKTRDVTPFFIWRVVVAVLVFALLSAR